jgi:hypothetical protein
MNLLLLLIGCLTLASCSWIKHPQATTLLTPPYEFVDQGAGMSQMTFQGEIQLTPKRSKHIYIFQRGKHCRIPHALNLSVGQTLAIPKNQVFSFAVIAPSTRWFEPTCQQTLTFTPTQDQYHVITNVYGNTCLSVVAAKKDEKVQVVVDEINNRHILPIALRIGRWCVGDYAPQPVSVPTSP